MLILASTSSYRKVLLSRLGIPFKVIGSDYDERQHDHLFANDPNDCATTIAYGKAVAVFGKVHAILDEDELTVDPWILAADQIVWCMKGTERIQLHKAGTADAAVEQLMQMSGRRIYSTTGVVLLSQDRLIKPDASTTILDARRFSREEAEAYVKKYKPLDCAGSYRMEDPGITLFENIHGDWTGAQGFPLLTIMRMLRGLGFLPA